MVTNPGTIALIFLTGLLIVVFFSLPIFGDKLVIIKPVYIYIGCWLTYILLLVFIKRNYSIRQITFLLSFLLFFVLIIPLGLFLTMSRERLLYYSARYGHAVVLRILLLKSKDKKEINEVLIDAATGGQEEIVRDMIQTGADVNFRPLENKTALMFAVHSGSVATVKVLIDNGADVNLRDKEGRTALMYAAQEDLPEVVRLLVKAKADVNAKSQWGETAISISKRFERNEITEILKTADAYNSLSGPIPTALTR